MTITVTLTHPSPCGCPILPSNDPSPWEWQTPHCGFRACSARVDGSWGLGAMYLSSLSPRARRNELPPLTSVSRSHSRFLTILRHRYLENIYHVILHSHTSLRSVTLYESIWYLRLRVTRYCDDRVVTILKILVDWVEGGHSHPDTQIPYTDIHIRKPTSCKITAPSRSPFASEKASSSLAGWP